MRTTRRPAEASRILTAGLAASLAMGLVLSGCGNTTERIEDRAAGAAGGQSSRTDGGPRKVASSSPVSGSDRNELSSPAAPPVVHRESTGKLARGNEDWRARRPAAGRIAGYSTAPSGPPGTRVGLKVSTSAATYRAIAFRLGAYRGGTGREVWRSDPQPG
jgi:hypothetical protein